METEKRLIDANAVDYENIACSQQQLEWLNRIIEKQPTVDAVEVVHGRWEDRPTGAYGRWQSWCSACGKHSGIGGIESNRHKPYCPNCGAKMDGDGNG